jgi:hypothetical protein
MGKQPLVLTGKEAVWAPETVWMTCGRKNSWPYRNLNSNPYVVQPVASCYTDYTILRERERERGGPAFIRTQAQKLTSHTVIHKD